MTAAVKALTRFARSDKGDEGALWGEDDDTNGTSDA